MNFGSLALGLGFLLILIGFWGLLTQKNLIKIVIGFSVVDTGVHIIMVGIGYLQGRTAPILDAALMQRTAAAGNQAGASADVGSLIVDPVPQALVLTAIVIGLGITALLLAYVVRLHEQRQSLDISSYEDLKW